jgi:hypothetical protein
MDADGGNPKIHVATTARTPTDTASAASLDIETLPDDLSCGPINADR